MNRKNIAPDCMVFYLLSQYPLENYDSRSQQERDFHMGKMMWVCNRVMGNQFFQMKFINYVDKYQKQHGFTIQQLLEADV